MQGGVKSALLKSFTIMGRPKKTETAKAEEPVIDDIQKEEEATSLDSNSVSETQPEKEVENVEASTEAEKQDSVSEDETTEKISPREAELMRLYPQYEKIWITSKGFVHPDGTPSYLLKDAKLFKNKYYNK